MAKVNVEFDTKTKELSVTFDGKAVANVYGISLSKSYYSDSDNENPYSLNLMTLDATQQKEEGYQSMQQIVAKDSSDAGDAVKQGAGTHPEHSDFLLLKKTVAKVSAGLTALLASRRGCY